MSSCPFCGEPLLSEDFECPCLQDDGEVFEEVFPNEFEDDPIYGPYDAWSDGLRELPEE